MVIIVQLVKYANRRLVVIYYVSGGGICDNLSDISINQFSNEIITGDCPDGYGLDDFRMQEEM